MYREPTVEWMKLRIKTTVWNTRKEKAFNQNSRKKKEFKTKQNNEDRLRNLRDIFKHTNIHIIRVPEGEEKEREIGNLFEKIMKEKFLNLVKEIYMQVEEAQRIPNKMDPTSPIPIHVIIKMPKVKDKEGILKERFKRKAVTYLQGSPHKTVS